MRVTSIIAAVAVAAVAVEAAQTGPHPSNRMEKRASNARRNPHPAPDPLWISFNNKASSPNDWISNAINALKGAAKQIAEIPLSRAKANFDDAKKANNGRDPVIRPSLLDIPTINPNTGLPTLSDALDGIGKWLRSFGQAPTVKLAQGSYTGLRSNPIFQQEWFFGIPFAEPPTGNNRFRSPIKKAASSASFNATTPPPACPQPNGYLVDFGNPANVRSEDCLTVNIWSPVGASSGNLGKLPVLFWLYGGGEIGNWANAYNSSALVLQSILQLQPMIVVTPNYRGNSFGFLAGTRVTNGEGGAVLNAGLQDVTAALEWTRDNIAAFGGDPNKITLAGQSSGAFNVGAQMLKDGKNPGAKPIYRAAIMLSGSPATEPAPKSNSAFADENYQRVCAALQLGRRISDEQYDCTIDQLRGVDAIKLGEAAFWPSTTPNPSIGWIQGPRYYAGNQPFQPTQDGVYHRDGAIAQIRRGEWPDVPLLTGNVRDEGTIFVSHSMDAAGLANNLKTIGFTNPNQDGVDDLVNKIIASYPDDPSQGAPYWPGYTSKTSRFGEGNQFERLAAILGDFAFVSKRRFMLNAYVGDDGMKGMKSPVWSYFFNETFNVPNPQDWVGITHGSDPPAWFAAYNFAPNLPYLPASAVSYQASKSMVAFVNKMNPNAFGNLYWPQYTKNNKVQMVMNGVPSIMGDTYRPQMKIFTDDPAPKLSNN